MEKFTDFNGDYSTLGYVLRFAKYVIEDNELGQTKSEENWILIDSLEEQIDSLEEQIKREKDV